MSRRKLLTPRETPRIIPRSRLRLCTVCGDGLELALGDSAFGEGPMLTTDMRVDVTMLTDVWPSGSTMWVVPMANEVVEKRVLEADDVEGEDVFVVEVLALDAVELEDIVGIGRFAVDEVWVDEDAFVEDELELKVATATCEPNDMVQCAALTVLLLQQLFPGMP